jgi:uridylate kinase
MKCDAFLKATQVDGIYDCDPKQNPNAIRYDQIDYQTALDKRLEIMDLTAMSMAQSAQLPIVVFNAHTSTFADIICGKGLYSIMKG